MTFNKSAVQTAVSADDISQRVLLDGLYGYFAHDVDSLRKAVREERTSSRCMYGRLTLILGAENRARYVLDNGQYVFTLFYPTDSHLNVERY